MNARLVRAFGVPGTASNAPPQPSGSRRAKRMPERPAGEAELRRLAGGHFEVAESAATNGKRPGNKAGAFVTSESSPAATGPGRRRGPAAAGSWSRACLHACALACGPVSARLASDAAILLSSGALTRVRLRMVAAMVLSFEPPCGLGCSTWLWNESARVGSSGFRSGHGRGDGALFDAALRLLCCVRAANGRPAAERVLRDAGRVRGAITVMRDHDRVVSAASATRSTATSERRLRYWERRTTAGC